MTTKVPLQSHALPTELQKDEKRKKMLYSIFINTLIAVRIRYSPDGARTRDLGVAFIRMRIEESNPQ